MKYHYYPKIVDKSNKAKNVRKRKAKQKKLNEQKQN